MPPLTTVSSNAVSSLLSLKGNVSATGSVADHGATTPSVDELMKANENYLHDFFVKHQKTILENTIQEYRIMFIYDNIPLLLGYVCLFVLGIVANSVQIYATVLQIRRRENTVCSKMFLQLAISQALLIVYLIPMDYLWRYSQVWEAGESACKLLVWIRFYLIVTVAAFTVLQTFVRYQVMRASVDIIDNIGSTTVSHHNNDSSSSSNGLSSAPLSDTSTNRNRTADEKGAGVRLRSSPSPVTRSLVNSDQKGVNDETSSHRNVSEDHVDGLNVGSGRPITQQQQQQQPQQPQQNGLRSWLTNVGITLAFLCWPRRFDISNKTLEKIANNCRSTTAKTTDPEMNKFAPKKRSFNENKLILLGWLLPVLLCAPEAAVYKLHVHKEIEGYQQCADIFVRPEELLFPRLFPSSATENDEDADGQSSEMSSYDYSDGQQRMANLTYDSKDILANLPSLSDRFSYMNNHNDTFHGNDDFTAKAKLEQPSLGSSLSNGRYAGAVSDDSSVVATMTDYGSTGALMTPGQIVYYLLLQSLTFVIPVGAICILNVLVIKCYLQIRKCNKSSNCNNNSQNCSNNIKHDEEMAPKQTSDQKATQFTGDQSQQRKKELWELRNWAAHRTLFLTASFGISYIVCWLPMTLLMAMRWNALFLKSNSDMSYQSYDTSAIQDYDSADNEGLLFHSSSTEVDVSNEDSVLGFWAFVEEWATAFGLLIGVVNPLLYGFFHLLGGNHKKLYDLQLCAGLIKNNIHSRLTSSTTLDNKAHLQQLFSSCCNTENNYRPPFKKLSTRSSTHRRHQNYYFNLNRLGARARLGAHPPDSMIALKKTSSSRLEQRQSNKCQQNCNSPTKPSILDKANAHCKKAELVE